MPSSHSRTRSLRAEDSRRGKTSDASFWNPPSKRVPEQPGAHGKFQGPWYGMGGVSRTLGLPAFSMQGDLGAYWAFSARINRFDPRSFRRSVSLFCQLTGYMMRVDVKILHVPKDDRAMPNINRPR